MINMCSEEGMRWSYKTEHFSLKKEGLLGSAFLDEAEIELSLNEFGKAGWELVSFIEVSDGMIAVFKQPFSKNHPRIVEHEEPQQQQTSIPAGDVQQPVEEQGTKPTDELDEEDVGDIKIF